ncbi:hypothetical protein ACT4R9_09650 [Ornithobacterium rhinotracheale]|uniref:hypothetical protein n=1 Tax=Ornithobacterium rhinotracheale TaxID=28251 RepID=UPI003FA4C97B
METIFDHNPSAEELSKIIGNKTKEEYFSDWIFSYENSILDIVLLYEMRQDENKASQYRQLIPDLYQQWQWGLDNVATSL